MFVLAGVYLILGYVDQEINYIFISFFCLNRGCAAAWEQKMQDTVGRSGAYKHKGSAGAASVSF